MIINTFFKVFLIFGVVNVAVSDNPEFTKNRGQSKFKYGYVISHKEGSSQAHLESRDGNLALGRYYVNLPNGNSQKVTYFADDVGFHSGVTYSSNSGKGSSKTHIAMGEKAFAAFKESDSSSATNTFAASTFAPQFGKKISSILSKPGAFPKLNYTPVPGGFYLTHESIDVSNNTTEQPNYVAGLTSQTFSTYKDFQGKYSEGVLQSKSNKQQTFYPTSENVKNEINQLHIQSTTPSIKTSDFSGSVFSSRIRPFQNQGQTVTVSSYLSDPDGLAYSKEKSIEKTSFAPIDAQIISEVQKHAEQIILKDLQKGQNVNVQNQFSKFTPTTQQFSTVTMQPIIVTDGGEYSINSIVSSTVAPEILKSSKDFQSSSLNAVRITEKNNNDQKSEDPGYFRVSLSPSLTSSITVSPAPHQLIDVKSTDRKSDSNNSTLCDSNLCDKSSGRKFSPHTLDAVKSNKEIELDPVVSGSGKNSHTFYPKNELAAERHFVTTIDVQKGISLEVQQNEDGSIQLAESFPFNKIRPAHQQFSRPTPAPLLSNSVTVSPGIFTPEPNLNLFSAPQQPYVLNTVTTAPGLFDVTPNQNLGVLQGFNDISSNPVQGQDRIGINRPDLENQIAPTVAPSPPPVTQSPAQITQELQQVQQNIQQLRQQILDNIDAQHEEEQRKQGAVDEERRQYFENLRKVEALKGQNAAAYNYEFTSQNIPIQPVVSTPAPIVQSNSVDIAPQTQFFQTPQPNYQADVSNVNNQIPVVYSSVQSTPAPEIYSKQVVAFNPQDFPASNAEKQVSFLNTQTVQNVNVYPQNKNQLAPQTFGNENLEQTISTFTTGDSQQLQQGVSSFTSNVQQPSSVYTSNIEQTVPTFTGANIQQTVSSYSNTLQQPAPAFSAHSVPSYNTGNLQQTLPTYAGSYQQVIAGYEDNSIQQTAPALATQKAEVNNYVQQVTPVTSFSRYAPSQVTLTEEKPNQVQGVAFVQGQVNTVPISFVPQVSAPETRVPDISKQSLLNPVVPFDYNRLLQSSLLSTFQQPSLLSLQSKTPVAVPALYSIPQTLAVPVQLPQTYKFLPYPDIAPVSNKQYHSTLTKATNKLKIQPLKPSSPDEDSQREAVQNLLAQPQFHRTYLYAGLPFNNRLQLRHIGKNQVSNSEQVRQQTLTRRGKSLSNLRIEYGFKPPLRPSVEFSEEVKPSIYGPSVKA